MSGFIQRSRHGTVYYFRRRVPRELRARLGRLHFYASLHTEELAEAKRRARAMAVVTDRIFTELKYVQGRDEDELFKTHYGLVVDWDPASGRPRVTATDLKVGEGDEARETAKGMLADLVAATAGAPRLSVAPTQPTTPTVEEAIAAVLADRDIKSSTKKEYARAFRFFKAFAGGDTRLGEIREERFSAYADHVRAHTEWSAKTQAFYITSAQRLFTFYGSRNSAVPKIVAAGLKPKRVMPAGHDREVFTLDDFEALFRHAAQFRSSEPAKWWVTVVPAFTGVRIEELAQAHLNGDFLCDAESGIHYLQIDELVRAIDERSRSSPKSVKSQAGWRRVPLHPLLVEGGFLDYLEDERKAGAITPFSRTWKPLKGARVKHAQKITDWGVESLKTLRAQGAITKERVGYFHSMRHSFTTFLSKADIAEEWRAAITGHAFGGINAQIYNKAKNDVSVSLPKIVKGLESLAEVLKRF
jgi:integrase